MGWREYDVKDGIIHFGTQGIDQLKQDIPKVKYSYFFRATNNEKEPEMGDFKSYNFNENKYEKGLSVSPHPKYAIFNNLKHLYAVTGDVVGEGSDGEPVLKNVKYIKKLNIKQAESEHEKKQNQTKIDFLKKLGMTDINKIKNVIQELNI